jgi:hypothetical protein
MDPANGTDVEVRCFCSRAPLLAIAGRDRTGEPYVHMKVHKQRRLYGEMVAISGVVMLRCRECLRWHRVTVKRTVEVEQAELPRRIPVGP